MSRPSFAPLAMCVSILSALASTGGRAQQPVPPDTPAQRDWELVRTVKNPYSGTHDFVLIPEQKQRDRDYYLSIAAVVCGDRADCSGYFWTDRNHIPATASMPVTDLAVLTASYDRSPRKVAPELRLACWLYPSREVGEFYKCAYSPGAKVPWKSPSEDSIRRYK